MNVVMTAGDAATALRVAGMAIANKTSLPILKNILITANSEVTFGATDLDTSIEFVADGNIKREGACCVEAGVISQLVMAMEGESPLNLYGNQDGNKVALINGKSVYNLPSLKAEEYPSLETISDEDKKIELELSFGELKECVRRTVFAVSQEASKPSLTGECWEIGEEESLIAATDTHRLITMNLPGYGHAGKESFIVPAKVLNFLRNMTGDDSEDVQIIFSENLISFSSASWRLVNRLISGQYPDVRRVQPGKHTTAWRIPTAPLMSALRRLRVLTKDHRTRADMTLFTVKEGNLVIRAVGYDSGDGAEEVEISAEGEDISIALNAKYLMDILAVCDDLTEIRMTTPLSPAAILSGEKWSAVIMPMDPGGIA